MTFGHRSCPSSVGLCQSKDWSDAELIWADWAAVAANIAKVGTPSNDLDLVACPLAGYRNHWHRQAIVNHGYIIFRWSDNQVLFMITNKIISMPACLRACVPLVSLQHLLRNQHEYQHLPLCNFSNHYTSRAGLLPKKQSLVDLALPRKRCAGRKTGLAECKTSYHNALIFVKFFFSFNFLFKKP